MRVDWKEYRMQPFREFGPLAESPDRICFGKVRPGAFQLHNKR